MQNTHNTPVICGTDFSRNAAAAATVAATLAARAGRPLILVHVADEFNSYANNKEELEYALRPIREKLGDELERLRAIHPDCEAELLTGRLAEEAILDLASARKPALIVVSSVSKAGFDRWTLGSVAERISQASPRPTLVVRSPEPYLAWARGERPLKIIVGVDFSGTSDAALQWVRELEAFGPCEITAAHLNWPPEDQKRLGVSSQCVMGDNEPLVQEVLERDLRAKVAAALGHHRAEICVRASWGCVDAHLVELAANSGADLIVAGSHQWHGLNRLRRRSISRNILHHAPMSVACVPAPVHTGTAAPHIARHERVLVAAAFDEHGAMAIPHAYATVEAGGVVRLLHVLEPLPLSKLLSSPEARTDHHQQEERTARAAAQLRAMIPPEAEKLGITSEVEVVESSEAARTICQAAARFGADLLCIGAHSHPGLIAKVMGPVALGTLKHSECPVLIVWPPRE